MDGSVPNSDARGQYNSYPHGGPSASEPLPAAYSNPGRLSSIEGIFRD